MHKIFSLFFLIIVAQSLFGQDSQRIALEKRRKAIQAKIDKTDAVLEELSGNKQANLLKLSALNARLRQHKALVSGVNKEIFLIEEDVQETEEIIAALNKDLQDLKEEYAAMIFFSSKNTASRSYNKVLYLFASETFNQLLARLHYLNHYKETRNYQIDQILLVKETLTRKKAQLMDDKLTREQLFDTEQREQKEIIQLKRSQQKLIASLSKQEAALKVQLAKEKEIAKELERKITETLRASLKNNTGKENGLYRNTAASAAKSEMLFVNKKSNLIWPVNEGFISSHFGKQEHPVLDKIWIDNLGVDITTRQNETVHAVFEGKVVAVTKVPGMQYMVTLQHGEYFTVYARLQEVKVKPGQQIDQTTPIGVVASNEEGMASLQFQVWHNQNKLNPEDWLSVE
ncbi:MAG: peptidoglycan DD-metalloendopeptidase family protein [Bacteroidota bacterium]